MSLQRISGVSSSTGVVRDQENYNTIPGVTIELLTNTGATGTFYKTDSNGSFVIPTYGVYGLRFTHAEFASVDISAGSVSQDMAVYMEPKNKTLPGVVITATKKKSAWLWLAVAGIAFYGYKKKWFK